LSLRSHPTRAAAHRQNDSPNDPDAAFTPARTGPQQQQQIAQTLEDDAQVVSNTQLDELLADEPPAVREEILSINTDATNLALQVALLVPILAGLLGLFAAFRMLRLPDVEPSASAEAAALA
jgi:hypothetical protein